MAEIHPDTDSPSSTASPPAGGRREDSLAEAKLKSTIRSIAVVLMAIAIFNLVFPVAVFMISISPGIERPVDNSGFGALMMLYLGLTFLLNVQIVLGAFRMLRLENYKSAQWAAGLSCLPIIIPSCVVGIPLGIWAWRTLASEEAMDLFADEE